MGKRISIPKNTTLAAGLAWLLLLLCLPVADAMAQRIYTCDDDAGNPVYQHKPCEDRDSTEVQLNQIRELNGPRYRYRHEPEKYDPTLDQNQDSGKLASINRYPEADLENYDDIALFDEVDPSAFPELGPETGPAERYMAAMQQAKRDCGPRYNGRSEEQLLKFVEMLDGLEGEARRDDELEEVYCHLEYMYRIERLRSDQ